MRKFVGPRMATQEQFQQLVIVMQEMARAITVQAQTMSANVPVGDVGHRQNIPEGKRTWQEIDGQISASKSKKEKHGDVINESERKRTWQEIDG